ncbi:hypothetical protein ACLRDC_06590 [Gluconacetobacter sacchari]|uniref:hypothetical protein n=1 Tax=Gluconacetobacter sacchari TaxID=92759 RepID=UPI0039B56A4C
MQPRVTRLSRKVLIGLGSASALAIAGAIAVYETSSLARRLLDIQVAAQRASVHPHRYVPVGLQQTPYVRFSRDFYT